MLVEAETHDGQRHSILLQNAETVRLIGPSTSMSPGPNQDTRADLDSTPQPSDAVDNQKAHSLAVSVSELALGQSVYLHLQGAARHTGISIQEHIVEK